MITSPFKIKNYVIKVIEATLIIDAQTIAKVILQTYITITIL